MELIKITQCDKYLDFRPLAALPQNLVPSSFLKILLNGFNHSDNTMVIDYSPADCDFLLLLKSLYPEITYVELALVSQKLNTLHDKIAITEEALFSHFGFKYDESVKLTNELLSYLPTHFCHWCAQKKWGPQDFAPLRSLTKDQISELNPYLKKINDPCSKNDGTQIFELLIELFLLNKDILPLLSLEITKWLSLLKHERYPIGSRQNHKNEELIQKLNWPLHSQAKWVRRGDKSGIELKFFFSHPQEFARSLIKLEQIKQQFETESTGKQLWSID